MVDTIVLLLLLATIYKSKLILKSNSINEQYMSMDGCGEIKAIFAFVVMFSHVAMKTTSGVFFHAFAYMGYLAVSVFLFISGYGVVKSMSKSKKYLDSFVKKRFFTIVIPFLITILIYWMYSFATDSPYSAKEVLVSLYNGVPIAENTWYMIACMFFYLSFFAFAKAFKGNKKAIAFGELTFCVIWILAVWSLGYPQWWYLSTFAFAAGMYWEIYEDKILSVFRKNYFACALPLMVLLLVSIYTTYRFESNIFKIICGTVFPILVFVFCMKVKLDSPILKFLGNISLEIYLIHVMFMRMFRGEIFTITNDLLYVSTVVAASILSAMLLHFVFNKIKALGVK